LHFPVRFVPDRFGALAHITAFYVFVYVVSHLCPIVFALDELQCLLSAKMSC